MIGFWQSVLDSSALPRSCICLCFYFPFDTGQCCGILNVLFIESGSSVLNVVFNFFLILKEKKKEYHQLCCTALIVLNVSECYLQVNYQFFFSQLEANIECFDFLCTVIGVLCWQQQSHMCSYHHTQGATSLQCEALSSEAACFGQDSVIEGKPFLQSFDDLYHFNFGGQNFRCHCCADFLIALTHLGG